MDCTDPIYCCVQVVCYESSGCSSATLSIAFVAPSPTTSSTCGGTNVGIPALSSGSYLTRSCSGLASDITQSFTLSNPNRAKVSIILTDGTGSQRCGYEWGGTTFRAYKSVQMSTASTISFTGATCGSSPCCASVYCEPSASFLYDDCIGLSYTQSFNSPATSGLAAGAVAAIVLVPLLALVGAGLLECRRRRQKQAEQMRLAQAQAQAVQVIQINPLPVQPGMVGVPYPPQPQQQSYVWR